MANSFYDNMGTLTPIDRLALQNTVDFRKENDNYERDGGGEEPCLIAPPEMRPVNWSLTRQKGFVDFTGKKLGRLTVIGFLHPRVKRDRPPREGSTPGRWVCRCDCGMYTWRRAKVLKSFMAMDPDTADKVSLCRLCCESLKRLRPEHQAFHKAKLHNQGEK